MECISCGYPLAEPHYACGHCELKSKLAIAEKQLADLRWDRDTLGEALALCEKSLASVIKVCKDEPAMQDRKYIYVGMDALEAHSKALAAIGQVKS